MGFVPTLLRMDAAELAEHTRRLGPIVHLATVTPSGGPHVVPIHADWHDGRLFAMVGLADAKIANIDVTPAVCLHWQVSEATGWDSLIVWGTALVRASVEEKRRLWTGVLSYDLDLFAPGGPEGTPDTGILEVTPQRAVLLRRYGYDGREEWSAG